MDIFKNLKLPIGMVAIVVAQAFGIIWYVAQLDSTVSNLDQAVNHMQTEATTIDVAVLQTDLENIKEKIIIMDEMHSAKFDPTDLEEALEELEDRIAKLETKDAIIENEMRTIMSEHNSFGDVLKSMGQSGYGDTRAYGNYG